MHKIKVKRGIVLFFILILSVLLSYTSYAETAKLSPSKFVVLNEFNPDETPVTLDYYVGTFEAEKDGIKRYIARTLLFFDINEIKDIKNKHISNAYIELNVKKGLDFISDAELEISAHKVTERWVTATWNSQPEFNDDIIGKTTITGNGKYIINIKKIVNDWSSNPSFNYGILIKGIDEDKTNDANLKQIESISLVVEYEDANECNKNNGVCRNECGNNEEEAKYGCGFLSGERCCVKKEIIGVTTTTIPIKEDITIQEIREIGEQEEKQPLSLQCTKCPDVNNDFVIDINDLSLVSLKQNSNELRYDLNNDNTIDKKDMECVSNDFDKSVSEIENCQHQTRIMRGRTAESEEIGIKEELSILEYQDDLSALNKLLQTFQPIKKSRRGKEKDTAQNILEATVKRRRDLMQILAKENPSAFIENIIPKGESSQFDKEIRKNIEEEISIEGNLEILHTDFFEEGRSENQYFISREVGGLFGMDVWPFKKRIERFNFYPVGELPPILGGSKVRIKKGYLLDNDLVVDLRKQRREIINEAENKITGNVAHDVNQDNFQVVDEAKPDTLGAQRVAIILINNKNLRDSILPSKEEIKNFVFNGPIQDSFKEMSYGKMWLTGDVYGWYRYYGTNLNLIGSERGVLAIADKDIDFKKYDRIAVLYTAGDGGWSHMGSMESITEDGIVRLVIMGVGIEPYYPFESWGLTFVHEFGHNLGLYHASLIHHCKNGIFRMDCKLLEYGNIYDPLGDPLGHELGSMGHHFNADAKDRLNWLSPEQLVYITSPGDYVLKPLESQDALVGKIEKSYAPWYYLEYRGRESSKNQKGGLLVYTTRFYPLIPDIRTLLIDSEPQLDIASRLEGLTPRDKEVFFDALSNYEKLDILTLLEGHTLLDELMGIKITNVKEDDREIIVNVDFIEVTCIRKLIARGGYLEKDRYNIYEDGDDKVVLTFKLENMDSISCKPRNILLEIAPAAWFKKGKYVQITEEGINGVGINLINPGIIQVNPNTFSAIHITLSRIEDISEGSYPIILKLKDIDSGDILSERTIWLKVISKQSLRIMDINKNGDIDIFDLLKVARQFGEFGDNLQGDINKDNKVDIEDLVIIAQNFD